MPNVFADLLVGFDDVWAEAHESSDLRKFTPLVDGRFLLDQRDEDFSQIVKQGISRDQTKNINRKENSR